MTKPQFNRNNFITLNGSRLFTAKEVADLIREYEGDVQHERTEILKQLTSILDRRKVCMEELFEELRDPAVAKHSIQQIEIIRYHIDKLLGEPYD